MNHKHSYARPWKQPWGKYRCWIITTITLVAEHFCWTFHSLFVFTYNSRRWRLEGNNNANLYLQPIHWFCVNTSFQFHVVLVLVLMTSRPIKASLSAGCWSWWGNEYMDVSVACFLFFLRCLKSASSYSTWQELKVRVGFPLCEAMSCGSVTGGPKKRVHEAMKSTSSLV